MTEPLVPPSSTPGAGRVHRSERTVRLADAGVDGRLRLDALARYLGEVAEEDVEEAGLDDGNGWLVRRTTWWITSRPRLGQPMTFATWCSGLGARWAERTTVATAGGGSSREQVLVSTTIWVAVDEAGRPSRLSDRFLELYAASAGDHRVSTRLAHPPLPPGAEARPWALRRSDLDVYGHVNNAIHWSALAEVAAGAWGSETWDADQWLPARAELEYRAATEPGEDVTLSWRWSPPAPAVLQVWLHRGGQVLASGSIRPDDRVPTRGPAGAGPARVLAGE